MKTGSRPIARIARTGEFTPPGMRRNARSYSSDERFIRASSTANSPVLFLPARVVLREVVEPDLLELRRGVEDRPVGAMKVVLVGDPVEDRVALLLGATVGHGEDAVGPVLVGG